MEMGTKEWPKTTLQCLAERITVGFVGSMSSLFVDEGVPLLRGQNVRPYSLDLTNLKFISPDTHRQWKKSALKSGDVVIVRVGYPGTACVIPEGIGELNAASLVIVRPNPNLLSPKYLSYVINSPWGKAQVAGRLVGAAQQVFNTQTAAEMEIPCPPLALQQKIVGILSAYDELIENCQRRIKILEAMARNLYREWFVHFRFPGHEAVRRVASPLGEIPDGWTVKPLRDATTKIGSGATPRGGKESYKTDGIPLVRSLNVYDYRFQFDDLAFIDEQQADDLDNVMVEVDDVFLNITGASVGRCAMVPSYIVPARVNQHVAIVRADRTLASPFYILDAINSDSRKAQLLALAQGGATREALTKDTIGNFEIVVPPASLLERYNVIASGIHRQRELLDRQAQNLRRTRDLLLPRLLSGQIEPARDK